MVELITYYDFVFVNQFMFLGGFRGVWGPTAKVLAKQASGLLFLRDVLMRKSTAEKYSLWCQVQPYFCTMDPGLLV